YDRETTSRIFERGEGRTFEEHGPHVRRFFPTQDLHHGWPRLRRVVARKSEAVTGAGGVAQQRSQRDGLRLGKVVAGNLPGLQDRVNIRVERETTILRGLE